MTNTQVEIVSLESAIERRRTFSSRATAAQIPWSFFDASASTATDLPYDDARAKVHTGRSLLPGEIGCFASHFALWQKFLRGSADQLIVLEDDVLVDWTFLARLAEFDLAAERIPYVRLFAKYPPRASIIRHSFIEPLRYIIEIRGPAWGTQGYALTRGGAQTLVNHCRSISRPVDMELDRPWAHGLRKLCIYPFPIIEMSAPSTIGDQRRGRITPPLPFTISVQSKLHKWSEYWHARAHQFGPK